jgi:hypothetical protein
VTGVLVIFKAGLVKHEAKQKYAYAALAGESGGAAAQSQGGSGGGGDRWAKSVSGIGSLNETHANHSASVVSGPGGGHLVTTTPRGGGEGGKEGDVLSVLVTTGDVFGCQTPDTTPHNVYRNVDVIPDNTEW